MVVTDSEMTSQGELQSSLQSVQQIQQAKNHTFSSLGRQSSIYSLTLDEFQNTLCESGKNFGSMNMDEFLNSIWTAEENQTQATTAMQAAAASHNTANPTHLPLVEANNTSTDQKRVKTKQPSLARQGSLTLPGPLSRKTVEEVWAEIHSNTQQEPRDQPQNNSTTNPRNPGSSSQQRQITFGEMTLEDFLVKAGVVREQTQSPALPQQQQQPPYNGGFYQNNNVTGSGFVTRPVMNLASVSSPGGGVNIAGYQPMAQTGEPSGVYPGSMKRGGYAAQPSSTAACFGGRMRNGGNGGGYGQVQSLGMGSPASPLTSDGLCANQMDGANQYGMDMGEMRGSGGGGGGRKRIIDGPIEKVVERRQRRMIKNRESAARSRARKQAYTVELEAELNQLKEENDHLKQSLAEIERKIRQQQFEETKMKAQARSQRANGKLRVIRRTTSSPC
ncbi:hypothetical protein ACH5RR_004584 [Cinchona calisaya]|uniref:BZIP domain-containing protein n=1 Tax=Cinchona calisaya TaxID=153742 RepID=A0ABD3AY09_9GENT